MLYGVLPERFGFATALVLPNIVAIVVPLSRSVLHILCRSPETYYIMGNAMTLAITMTALHLDRPGVVAALCCVSLSKIPLSMMDAYPARGRVGATILIYTLAITLASIYGISVVYPQVPLADRRIDFGSAWSVALSSVASSAIAKLLPFCAKNIIFSIVWPRQLVVVESNIKTVMVDRPTATLVTAAHRLLASEIGLPSAKPNGQPNAGQAQIAGSPISDSDLRSRGAAIFPLHAVPTPAVPGHRIVPLTFSEPGGGNDGHR